jgi:hypothetical protein
VPPGHKFSVPFGLNLSDHACWTLRLIVWGKNFTV